MLLSAQQKNAQTMLNRALRNRLMNVGNSGLNALRQRP